MKSRHILFFLLLITVNYAHAETTSTAEELKQYDVEIIIFEDAHARYINSESWNKNTIEPNESTVENKENGNIEKWSNVLETDKKTATFESIKPKILSKEYKRINNSSEFNVLLYTAWRQTGLKESEAFEININELDNTHKNKSENTITGNLKVVLARYLHFYSQLEYQRKSSPDITNEALSDSAATESPTPDESQNTELTPGDIIYPIQSHRRMRSKELHYIDHPLVGILIQINPVENDQIEKIEQVSVAQPRNAALAHR
jgi:Peptidoglycan-binding protein, CsiV